MAVKGAMSFGSSVKEKTWNAEASGGLYGNVKGS